MVIISSGGLVRNAHIFYGGKEVISSGGADYGARIESSAFVSVMLGGSMTSAYIGSWATVTVEAGLVSAPRIDGGASMSVVGALTGSHTYSWGVMSQATLTNQALLTIGLYGSGRDIQVRSGWVTVSSGGFVQRTYLGGSSGTSGNARLILENGAGANQTIVSSNGVMTLSSGATASETVISSGGSVEVYGSATASGVTVNIGGVLVVGNLASAVKVVENGGFVYVESAQVSFQSNNLSGLVLN
ncbi:MAG: hypothetical protein IKQ82_04040, partial [Lentisphaeria bacterium]|nr:hypothetical protein [Lentisphaeria bacterium]